MTIADYLSSPYGKGAAFANVGREKSILDMEYEKLSNKFIHKIYKYNDSIIFHIVVPSRETSEEKDISYDVIIEVPLRGLDTNENTVENTDIRVFSNCPSFIFTYANAFFRRKVFCNWLRSKLNSEIYQRDRENTKNPYGIIGLERSLYLAMKYINGSGLHYLSKINTILNKVNGYAQIAMNVRSQEDILSNRRKEKIKQDKKEVKKENATKKKSNKKGIHYVSTTKKVSKVKRVNKVKKI